MWRNVIILRGVPAAQFPTPRCHWNNQGDDASECGRILCQGSYAKRQQEHQDRHLSQGEELDTDGVPLLQLGGYNHLLPAHEATLVRDEEHKVIMQWHAPDIKIIPTVFLKRWTHASEWRTSLALACSRGHATIIFQTCSPNVSAIRRANRHECFAKTFGNVIPPSNHDVAGGSSERSTRFLIRAWACHVL